MSDIFKWMYALILHGTLLTSPMLMAQDTPRVENASAQQPETILPDTAKKPPQVTESEAAQSTGIYLELPADPAIVNTFRRLAEALAVKYKIQIRDAGSSESGPEFIEAELRIKQDAEFDKVEKIFGTLVSFGVSRVRLSGSFEGQNMIVINAPANASWKLIHDLETFLAKLDGFKFDVRVRANDAPPTATKYDALFPEFTPNELTTRTQFEILDQDVSRSSNAPVPTVTVDEEQLKIFHLQHSNANQTAAMIEQLFGGEIVTVAVDARTNTLIVRSNEPLLQQIEAILLRLDEQPGKQAPIVSSTTGTTANSTITTTPDATATSEPSIVPIAEYRRRLNELELPMLQFAEKVRSTEASLGKDHPESLKQRASLRESIQKTFTARQEIQRTELAEFTRRLRRMQQSIDSRDLIAEKIVDRRLEELLNPEANWDSVLSDMLVESNPKVAQPAAKTATADTKLPAQLQGSWEVEELSITSVGIDISTISPKARLSIARDHLVVPFEGGITVTMQYELAGGDPLRVNLTLDPNGSKHRTFGIIKYSEDSLWLCFREPADKGEAPLQESDRPVDFLPGERNYCIKCRRNSPDSGNTPAPPTSIKANSIEAEITFTIPGDERKVFYWRGFPIDGTNTAVVAHENFRPSSNAKQLNADAEIFQKSIESISVIVGTGPGIRALPAKLERINPDLGLLLLSVEQEYIFKSLPLDLVGPTAGQKIKTHAQSTEQYMLTELTEISPGVSHAELSQQHHSKWCGSALTGLSRQRFLGLAIALPGESTEESYGIIPAPAIAQWLEIPSSTIGVIQMSRSISGESDSERKLEPAPASSAERDSFPAPGWSPNSDAE